MQQTPTQNPTDAIELSPVPGAPGTPEEIVRELKTVALLEGLEDREYLWLATHGCVRSAAEGTLVFREGEPACHMNILLHGEIQVRRNTSPIALFIGQAGQLTGKLPFSRMKNYGGDGYTGGPTWVLDIHEDLFPAMLEAIPSMTQRCVSILLDRVREVTRLEQQAEKLTALGKLAANLAHELNNPASAAQRSADQLYKDLRNYRELSFQIGAMSANAPETPRIRQWFEQTRARMTAFSAQPHSMLSPLASDDREQEFIRWLEAHEVPDAWAVAPSFAESALGFDQLDELVQIAPAPLLPKLLTAFSNSLRIEHAAETVIDSTSRIFDLISAVKDYSYMDQAPVQEVDLAQSLLITLVMFQSRMGHIKLETAFDALLEPISAYGGELSQVWTALIENALDAMRDTGTLTLRTCASGDQAVVEVIDSGVGIPADIQSRIFEPFFTTKAPGSGLGLGLDIAMRIVRRHSGTLTVQSRLGETCFQVRLPRERAGAY